MGGPLAWGWRRPTLSQLELSPPLFRSPPPPMDQLGKKMSSDVVFPDWVATWGVPASAVLGLVFGIWLWQRVAQIKVRGGGAVRADGGREYLLEEEQRGEGELGELGRAAAAAPRAMAGVRGACAPPRPPRVPIVPRGPARDGPPPPARRGEGRRPAGRDRRGRQLLPLHRVQVHLLLHGARAGWRAGGLGGGRPASRAHRAATHPPRDEPPRCPRPPPPFRRVQGVFSILIFVLLSSQDGFATKWHEDESGVLRAPALYNGEGVFVRVRACVQVCVRGGGGRRVRGRGWQAVRRSNGGRA